MFLLNLFNGFCMALADSVPGVSGGTIAFILGFYEKLLESISVIASNNKEKMKDSVAFLIKLGIGWIIGFLLAVSFLSRMFEKNIYFMSSLFIGLTLSSIVYIIKSERKKIDFKFSYLFYTAFGLILVISISFMREKLGDHGSINMSTLSAFQYLYLFISGMVAISAMVLPGISGSTVLLIFGVYIPIITAIKNIFLFDFSAMTGIAVFAFGVLFGLISSVRLIRRAFVKYRSKMIYFIIGLTTGSVFAIMNGPTTLDVPIEMLNFSNFNILGFLLGIILLVTLGYISDHNKKIVNKTKIS